MRLLSWRAWLLRGTYPRLLFPILGISAAIFVLRYSLLMQAEVQKARIARDHQIVLIEHYLPTLLVMAAEDTNPARSTQAILEESLRVHPEVRRVTWSFQGSSQSAERRVAPPAQAPTWFLPLAALPPMRETSSKRLADGTEATLDLEMEESVYAGTIWLAVKAQLPTSALLLFTIFSLLTMLLRANDRMLRRLTTATNRFRAGELSARMAETGTLEVRAVARAFNTMATQIQNLVASLQATKNERSAQQHLTREILDALPLPVFVLDCKGCFISANKAWEEFFQQSAASVIGTQFPQYMSTDSRMADLLPASDVLVKIDAEKVREMAYFKASFTLANGDKGGTVGALVDITERKQAQEALLAEKERAVVTLSSIGDGVITTNAQGHVESINEAAQFLTGFGASQALGMPLWAVFQRDASSSALPHGLFMESLHQVGAPVQALNQLLVHRSGERYAIEFTAAPIRQSQGVQTGCVLVFRDVTEARDLRQSLSWQARHDSLTGLNNRASLTEQLTQSMYLARRAQELLGVCLLDLDHFQTINEKYGEWISNRLLKAVALRLQGFAQASTDIARLGGDEFVLLLRGDGELQHIQDNVATLLEMLAQPYAIDEHLIHCTATAGLAVFPLDDAGPETLLRHADQAMCQAKQFGRGSVHLFDIQQDQEVQTHYTEMERLRQALQQNEFCLYYQPKVHMRSGAVVGLEALLRWQHPEFGLLAPGQFLPTMEHTDLIVETGEWVLHQALRQLQSWSMQGHNWCISVNIAARHFHRADFVERLRVLLAEYPLAPAHQLELEILESAALQDIPHMREVMQGCQALGVCFALDDFGTGFSSLSYLKRLPAETIKIDRMFVDGILDDAEDMALVSAIVGLARAFERSVIAEGVETPAQAAKLLELGCELGQGYGIAKPMPVHEVVHWAAHYHGIGAVA